MSNVRVYPAPTIPQEPAVKRPAFHVTAIFVTDPDDSTDLTAADIKAGVEARLSGEAFYCTDAGYPVRLHTPVGVIVEAVEVDAEPDGYSLLIERLVALRDFHSDDEEASAGFLPQQALSEAIELLRTHALPEDHPLAIR